jgi:hypothetical protein
VFKGVIWELERAVCLPVERGRYQEIRPGEAKSRHHEGSPASVMSLRKQRHKRQKTGKAGYQGRIEKIERL